MFEIHVKDLMRRRQVMMDMADVDRMIRGKTVAVTGAGGFIGSEIVRQVAGYGPRHVTLIDNSEFNLYEIDRRLDVPRIAAWADVRDSQRMQTLIRADVVFHAAAMKHVPLSESNPGEAIKTNIIGTMNVRDAARQNGVGTFVMISTDKAVSPSNMMGATKRVAELYCKDACVVRFGNVLGSSGSVVPLFKEQIASGGPVTVTHQDMERYFMSVTEAVELVLKAAAHGQPGIYALDMGDSVRISDLASDMIMLSGKRGVPIEFTGLRPGEKLREEVFYGTEDFCETGVPGLRHARGV